MIGMLIMRLCKLMIFVNFEGDVTSYVIDFAFKFFFFFFYLQKSFQTTLIICVMLRKISLMILKTGNIKLYRAQSKEFVK